MATPTMTHSPPAPDPPPPAGPVPLLDGEALSVAATYEATGLLPGLEPRALVGRLRRIACAALRRNRQYEAELAIFMGRAAPAGD